MIQALIPAITELAGGWLKGKAEQKAAEARAKVAKAEAEAEVMKAAAFTNPLASSRPISSKERTNFLPFKAPMVETKKGTSSWLISRRTDSNSLKYCGVEESIWRTTAPLYP